MAIKIGANEVVDKYIGSQLIERAYKGTDLIFDAYSEVDGSLPLTFDSRVEHTLTDYTVHGTAEGAGAQTENLFDKDAKDTDNGYVPACYISNSGAVVANNSFIVSEYIEVDEQTIYYLYSLLNYGTAAALCFYDSSKTYLSGERILNKTNITSPENAAYLRTSVQTSQSMKDNAVVSKTSVSTYIPYGYQIPLTVTSGQNTDTYPLYIGGSKLGAEEYVDYAEQKIYKDVSGTLTPTDPPLPFPAISAYQGENTLSSTETVGSVTIKGRIKETT